MGRLWPKISKIIVTNLGLVFSPTLPITQALNVILREQPDENWMDKIRALTVNL